MKPASRVPTPRCHVHQTNHHLRQRDWQTKKISLGPAGIANFAERTIGYTPETNKDVSVVFLNNKKAGLTANIRDINEIALSDFTTSSKKYLEESDALVIIGWGKDTEKPAQLLAYNILDDHPHLSIDVQSVRGDTIMVLDNLYSLNWTAIPREQPPVELTLASNLPHTTREDLMAAFEPHPTITTDHITVHNHLREQMPSLQGKQAREILENLADSRTPDLDQQSKLIALLADNIPVRDAILTTALADKKFVDPLTQLFKNAPQEHQGELATLAGVISYAHGQIIPAKTLNEYASETTHRSTSLNNLLSTGIAINAHPDGVKTALSRATDDMIFKHVDAAWTATHAPKQPFAPLTKPSTPTNTPKNPPTTPPLAPRRSL